MAVLWSSAAPAAAASVNLKCENITFELTPLLIMRNIEQDRTKLFWHHDLERLRQSVSLLHKKTAGLDIASHENLRRVSEIANLIILLDEMQNTLSTHTKTLSPNLRNIILGRWLPKLSKIVSQLHLTNRCSFLQVHTDFKNGTGINSTLQDHKGVWYGEKGSKVFIKSSLGGYAQKNSNYLISPSNPQDIVTKLSASGKIYFLASVIFILILIALHKSKSHHKKIAKRSRETRYSTNLTVVAKIGTISTTATIVDLSMRGAKIRCNSLPTKTGSISILLQEESLQASVKWSNDYYAGLLFKKPLKEETLMKLLHPDANCCGK